MVQHLEAHRMSLPKALWLRRHILRVSAKESISSPQTQTALLSLTHAFWRQSFRCPDGSLQNPLEFCHRLSLGAGVGFLQVLLSRKEKAQTQLSWSEATIISGAGSCSQGTGHVFCLGEIDNCRSCIDWATSRPGRLRNKERGAAFAAGRESKFFTRSLPWLMATEGFCNRHQSPWVNSGHICKTACCTL